LLLHPKIHDTIGHERGYPQHWKSFKRFPFNALVTAPASRNRYWSAFVLLLPRTRMDLRPSRFFNPDSGLRRLLARFRSGAEALPMLTEATLGASALRLRGLGPRFLARSRQVRPPIDLDRDRLLSYERLENLLLSDCSPADRSWSRPAPLLREARESSSL
jgi:hypothetical protein